MASPFDLSPKKGPEFQLMSMQAGGWIDRMRGGAFANQKSYPAEKLLLAKNFENEMDPANDFRHKIKDCSTPGPGE